MVVQTNRVNFNDLPTKLIDIAKTRLTNANIITGKASSPCTDQQIAVILELIADAYRIGTRIGAEDEQARVKLYANLLKGIK